MQIWYAQKKKKRWVRDMSAGDTRRVLTWEMVDGVKNVKALLAANGFQNPDLEDGVVYASGCVRPHPPYFQVIFLTAPKKWELRCLDVKIACLLAAGFSRDVSLRGPLEWGPRAHVVFGN